MPLTSLEPDRRCGLRERKKVRTRQAIRHAAVELVAANGYAKTTVEQIADAAEVSPATFFRYFRSKDSALLANGLAELVISALRQQPPGVSTVKAVRQALAVIEDIVSADEWAFERTCLALVCSVPELREPQHAEHRRIGAMLAQAECARLGRAPGDFEVQVFFGALTGVVRTVLDNGRDVPGLLFEALDFIEAGMPLP